MPVTFLLILSLPQASPLVNFFHFHETFLVHSDYDACREYLNAFKISYNKVCKREVFLSRNNHVLPSIAPVKCTQHFNPTYCNIVVLIYMLHMLQLWGFFRSVSASFFRVTINFIDRDGDKMTVNAKVGDSLLDVAKDNDVDLEG